VSSFGLLFRPQGPSLLPYDPAERVIWCEGMGDLDAVRHAGNALGEVVAARLRILLRDCGVVLQGAGVCACVKQLYRRPGGCDHSVRRQLRGCRCERSYRLHQ